MNVSTLLANKEAEHDQETLNKIQAKLNQIRKKRQEEKYKSNPNFMEDDFSSSGFTSPTQSMRLNILDRSR